MATSAADSLTPPNAQAALDTIVAHDTAKSAVPVHTFDPDVPPEAKAAAAGKGQDKLNNVNKGQSRLRVLQFYEWSPVSS